MPERNDLPANPDAEFISVAVTCGLLADCHQKFAMAIGKFPLARKGLGFHSDIRPWLQALPMRRQQIGQYFRAVAGEKPEGHRGLLTVNGDVRTNERATDGLRILNDGAPPFET